MKNLHSLDVEIRRSVLIVRLLLRTTHTIKLPDVSFFKPPTVFKFGSRRIRKQQYRITRRLYGAAFFRATSIERTVNVFQKITYTH